MHSRGEGGASKTRTVRIDSNGVAADIVVIKKGGSLQMDHFGFSRNFVYLTWPANIPDLYRISILYFDS